MQWYLAKIVFRIISGDGNHTPQFDEQLRLIKACNDLDAFEQARALGLQEQDLFENDNQLKVEWRFIDIAELRPFPELEHGAEIYSGIKEEEDAGRYSEVIRKKAEYIQDNLQRRYLQPI